MSQPRIDFSVVDRELEEVGLEEEDILFAVGGFSKEWISSYAQLFYMDASGKSSDDVKKLLESCDASVAEKLRRMASEGRMVDAYVCIGVDRELADGEELATAETTHSRFVSRKYFVDATRAPEEMFRRLALLWPAAPAGERAANPVLPEIASRLRSIRSDLQKLKAAHMPIEPGAKTS